MPKKGAAPAARPANETAQVDGVAPPEDTPPPPARKGGRRTPEAAVPNQYVEAQDAAEVAADTTDWTRPEYADSPGEFEFGSLDRDDEFYSVIWWGQEGTGKSTDVALVTQAVPQEQPILIINAEGGLKRRPLAFHGVEVSRIRTYPKPGQPLTFEGLERLFYRLLDDFDKNPKAWGAICWDSVTEIVQTLLDNVIDDDIRKIAEILKKAGKGRAGRSGNVKLRERFDTDRDDYRVMSNQVRLLLRKYKTLPCHLLLTALERRDEDERTRKVVYGPAMNPALQTDVLGYVDVVLHTKVEHVKGDPVYFAVTTAAADARGKDRLGGLPYELVDPAAHRVFAYLTGELSEDADPVQKLLPGESSTVRRRSIAGNGNAQLADPIREEVYHTKDGTPDGPPLTGEEDDPEPPKRAPARRTPARKSAAQRKAEEADKDREEAEANAQARTELQEEGVVDKTPPPRAARKGGRRAPAAKSDTPTPGSGFSDEPPF